MRIYVGPFKSWIGPYQIADLLQKVGVSEDKCYSIGEYLNTTWLKSVCEWLHSKKNRTIKVKLDDYDTWNMDSTLAIIILPMLKQLHVTKHGAPNVDDADVPEGLGLRSNECTPKENEWDIDENHFKRFDWVMDELIWAFTQMHPDTDWETHYHSGVSDIQFKDAENGFSQMVRGPNDTHEFDAEGYTAHSKRIDNGLVLFGKYYRGLWD